MDETKTVTCMDKTKIGALIDEIHYKSETMKLEMMYETNDFGWIADTAAEIETAAKQLRGELKE